LQNYSLHYVGDWENGTISADYFGEFAAALKSKLNADQDFVGIMSNGTSGDINIWEFIKQENYPTGNFEKSKFIAGDLVKKMGPSLKSLEWDENPDLAVEFKEIEVVCRKPSPDEVEKAKEIVATSNYHQIEINNDGMKRIYAREQVLLNEYPNRINFSNSSD
jgi:neutral ceramidase